MKKFKIAFITSEVVPYSKTGGLADVSGSLPFVLGDMKHDVLLFSPKYGSIDTKAFPLAAVKHTKDMKITVGGQDYSFDLLTPAKEKKGAKVYFINQPKLFDRHSLYVHPKTGKDYTDNDIRFIFFCRAVLESLEQLKFKPDIIHVNDWQTALIPALLKTSEKGNHFFEHTKTILTIHNLAFHGLFKKGKFTNLGLDKSYFYSMSPFEYWGKINFLKAGIVLADIVNAVSETYAREIQTTDEYGCGLEGVLKNRSETVYGVLDGIDYNEWSPETDSLIESNYSIDNLEKKYKNKQKLLAISGLSKTRINKPLIATISRLTDQKGFDLIEKIANKLFELDFTFVLLGTGEKKYHQLFRKLQKKYPDKIKANLLFDNKLAHLIEAGADMFLMPSKYEPCGLNQLYSMKYGTVPIVRKTGGLADSVVDFDEDRQKSTGFVFEEYSGKVLLETIKRALKLYPNKRSWNALIKRGMKKDFSWKKSAKAYVKLYHKALSL